MLSTVLVVHNGLSFRVGQEGNSNQNMKAFTAPINLHAQITAPVIVGGKGSACANVANFAHRGNFVIGM